MSLLDSLPDKPEKSGSLLDSLPDQSREEYPNIDKVPVSGSRRLSDPAKPVHYQPTDTVLPRRILSEYDVNAGDFSDIGGSIQGAQNISQAPRKIQALTLHEQPDMLTAMQQAEKAKQEGIPTDKNRPLIESGNILATSPRVGSLTRAARTIFHNKREDTRTFQQYDPSNPIAKEQIEPVAPMVEMLNPVNLLSGAAETLGAFAGNKQDQQAVLGRVVQAMQSLPISQGAAHAKGSSRYGARAEQADLDSLFSTYKAYSGVEDVTPQWEAAVAAKDDAAIRALLPKKKAFDAAMAPLEDIARTKPTKIQVYKAIDEIRKAGLSEEAQAATETTGREVKPSPQIKQQSVLDTTFPKEDVNVQAAEERGVGHNIEETPQEVANGTDIISQPGESGAEINQQEGTGNLDTQPREGSGAEPAQSKGEAAPEIAQEVQDGETAREATQDGAQEAPAQEDGREAGLAQETAGGDADRLAEETATQGDITAQEVLNEPKTEVPGQEMDAAGAAMGRDGRESGGLPASQEVEPAAADIPPRTSAVDNDGRVQGDVSADPGKIQPSEDGRVANPENAGTGPGEVRGAGDRHDPARAVLSSLTEPQPVKALRDLHGKETVAKLIADSMITSLGGGKIGLTKRGEKWLKENAPPSDEIPSQGKVTGYHGGSRKVLTEGIKIGGDGAFYTSSPRVASVHAQRNADRAIHAADLEMKNPYVVDYNGTDITKNNAEEAIYEAKQKGHDGVIIKNFIDMPENKLDVAKRFGKASAYKSDIYIIFDGKQAGNIREVDRKGASKNPAKENPDEKAQIPEPETAAVAPAEKGAGGEPDGSGTREDAAVPSLRDTPDRNAAIQEREDAVAEYQKTLDRERPVGGPAKKEAPTVSGPQALTLPQVEQSLISSGFTKEEAAAVRGHLKSVDDHGKEVLRKSSPDSLMLKDEAVFLKPEIQEAIDTVVNRGKAQPSIEPPAKPVTLETAKIEGKKIPKEPEQPAGTVKEPLTVDDRHKTLFDRYVDILADGDERALAEFEASPEWQALNGMPGDVEEVIQQAGAETARQALTDMDNGNVEAAQTRVNALSQGEERLTSLKNEQTAKESGPQDKWEYTREGIIDEGKRLVDSGAFDPRQAARDIVQNPRMILTHEQQAGLLYDRQRIYNEYEGMADALAKAMAEQDNQAVVTLRQQRAALEDALEANAQAATYLGTGWSAFGQVRQAFMDKDYSPLWLQTRAKAALGKGELPEHIKSEMAEMSVQIKKLEAEYQKALKHAEELEAQKAVERIKGEVKTKKTIQKEKSAEGKEARQKEFHSLAEKLKKVLDPNKLSINLAIVDPEAGRIIGEMARLKIIDGITGAKEIVEDIHSELSGQVSKRDIQDTLSGYGKTAELSQDEINVTLREVRRQLRLFSALEDAESGTVPLHSGMQRDPVSDEVRELTQKVKEVMRETGLDQSDQTPEQQWRTAMDTVHTRLKNQIRDLDKQIDQHKKTRKPLRKLDYDEEAKALVKLRDERRGTLEEIDRINKLMEKEPVADETPELAKLAKFMADTERAIKAEENRLERSTEEYRKKAAGEVAPAKAKTHVPDTPRLEELRQQRDEAKAQYQALKQKAKRDPEEARANAALKAIEKAIEKNEAALRGEKPEKQGQGAPVSKELALRRIYNDSLRQALKEMKEAQKTPKDPEEAKLKAYKTRLLKRESDLNEMLTTENFDKSARKVLKLDSEAEKLASRVAQKKELVEARMRQLQRASLGGLDKKIYLFGKGLRFSILSGTKVLWKISVASMVTRPLQTTMEEAAGALNLLAMGPKYRAIAAGAPRQGGGFNARAEAAAYVQWFKSEQYRNMWDELRQGKMSIEIKYGNKDGTEDRRGIQTWGETKMDHADYIFDFPGRLHGTLKAVAYTQEFHRALQIITEHFIRNGRDMSDPINQLLVKNLAETEANRARLMSDHVVQGAYKAFLRTIESKGSAGGKIAAALVRANFPITKVPLNYFSEATSFLPPVGWTKARLLRLSAELRVKETPEGKELLGEALFQAALEEMTDAEKDAYVRALKKQTVGVVVGATIGYFLYKHFGGYYKRGERRKRGELKPGEIQIMGVNLADTWFHAPFFESLQSWAMLHHMQDLADRKDDKAAKAAKRHNEPAPEKTGEFEKAATGALAAGVGMVDRVPYVGTPIRVYNQLQSYQGTLDYASALLLRAVLPQLGAEAAKNSDTIDDVVVPRKTQTIGQKIMVAIPGLRGKLPIDPKKLKRMDIGDLAVIASHADTLKADKKELAKIFGAKLKHDYSELKDKDPESLKVYRDIYGSLKR